MKKKKIKNNCIYVTHQPEHTLFTIIVVDVDKFPLSKNTHDNLDRLRGISDLGFIFKTKAGINVEKFTNLYRGCCYMTTEEPKASDVLYMSEYSREIFERHVGIIITELSLVEYISEEMEKKLVKVNISDLSRPIYQERRLGEFEYYEIYKEHTPSWYMKEEDNSRMYSTHTSDSSLMYFRPSILKHIQQLCTPEYIQTFTEPDPRYFFASVCRYLGLEILNMRIDEV